MACWVCEDRGARPNGDHLVDIRDLDNDSLWAVHRRGLLAKSKYFCAVYNCFQKDLIPVKQIFV